MGVNQSEKAIENSSVGIARRYGFRSIKVGDNGLPDRLFFKNGRHFWVEFKRPGGRLSPLQQAVINDLRSFGETVLIVDSVETFTSQLKEIENESR